MRRLGAKRAVLGAVPALSIDDGTKRHPPPTVGKAHSMGTEEKLLSFLTLDFDELFGFSSGGSLYGGSLYGGSLCGVGLPLWF
jgi:hypothetical protein